MTLEQFGSRRASAASSSVVLSATSIASDQPDSEGPTAKKRRFNNDWAEGRVRLQYDKDNNVMFCEWCCRFDKKSTGTSLSRGARQWSWRVSRSTNSQDSTEILRQLNGPVLGQSVVKSESEADSSDSEDDIDSWMCVCIQSVNA